MKNNNKGFSLVELIVVIAIMAILAAVAVVGVSVYIPKAQQAADEQLASDIEYILELAVQSGELADGDYVVIRYDANAQFGGTTEAGAKIDAVMKSAYGDNWQNELKLVYSDWPTLVTADRETMAFVNASSFSTDSMDSLLTKVQGVTDELTVFMEGGSFTPSEELAAYYESMGIDYTTDPQAASNATVLFVGSIISNLNTTDAEFYNAWMQQDFSSETDRVSAAAAEYAAVLAKAQYLDSKNAENNYVATLEAAEEAQIITVMNQLKSTMRNDANQSGYYGNASAENPIDTTSQCYADAMAFKAYMTGMTSAKDDLAEKTDLSSDNYFADGTVLGYVTNYISVGEILSNLDAENGFVFYYANGEIFSITG